MKKIIKKLLFIFIGLAIITSSVLLIRAAGGGDGGDEVNCALDPGSCVNLGLVGYWNFEEGSGQTATDLSGNSNTGTLGADANVGIRGFCRDLFDGNWADIRDLNDFSKR